jgi:NADH-quinone oxidoreductase subunit M
MDNLISIVTFAPALGALILAVFLRGDDAAPHSATPNGRPC